MRSRRRAARQAAAERRKRRLAVVGFVVLVVLVAVQVPRTLRILNGPQQQAARPSSPCEVAAKPKGGQPAKAPRKTAAPRPKAVRLARFAPRDPFVQGGAGEPPTATPVVRRRPTPAPPALDPVVPVKVVLARDPFLPPGRAEPAPRDPLGPTPAPTSGTHFTVVLASIPQRVGAGRANEALQRARRAGMAEAGLLNSSQYRHLRSGFFVVFNGDFPSYSRAEQARRQARANGFPGAYTRALNAPLPGGSGAGSAAGCLQAGSQRPPTAACS